MLRKPECRRTIEWLDTGCILPRRRPCRERVEAMVAGLPERLHLTLTCRYELDGEGVWSLVRIGVGIGVSRERARQMGR